MRAIYNNYQKYPIKAGSQGIQESPEGSKEKTYFNFNRRHDVNTSFKYSLIVIKKIKPHLTVRRKKCA